jgi:hypothetical protein
MARLLALATVATVALVLAPAAAARAAIRVEAIPKRLTCGDAIVPGVLAERDTTGSRRVRIRAIDVATGKVWWHKRVRATRRHWRWWYLASGMDGNCGETKIEYRGRGDRIVYRVRFREEGV